MKRTSLGILLGTSLFCASTAFAQDSLAIGGNVGLYVPTSSETRDAFGASWFSWGFGPVPLGASNGKRFSSDVGFLSRRSNGNRLLIIRPTFGFSQTFGDASRSSVPYAAIRVGPAYADYAISKGNSRTSDRKVGFCANAELGFIFNQVFTLSGRYDVMSEFSGFNFNGWTLEARFQIARF